jgi:thiazole/oxazole-forming peptide maturase SagD family component
MALEEKTEETTTYIPVVDAELHTLRAVWDDLLCPAGRFKTPLSLMERGVLRMRQQMLEAGFFGGDEPSMPFDPRYPVPPRWQLILNYLYREGWTSDPRLLFDQLQNDVPKVFSTRLRGNIDALVMDGRRPDSPLFCKAVGSDFEETISKTIGEFLERAALLRYRERDLRCASFDELQKKGAHALNPFDVAGFSDWQKERFPGRKLDEQSKFHWVECDELTTGTTAYVPAQLVFWNYKIPEGSQEPLLRESNSSGGAGHFSLEEATVAGICELLQRDGFLWHWLNDVPPPVIRTEETTDATLREIVQKCRRYGFETFFLNTTLDFEITSCMCALVRPDATGDGAMVGFGGGCDFDVEEALRKSAFEAVSALHWTYIRATGRGYAIDAGYRPFEDQNIHVPQRAWLWQRREMVARLMPFLSGPRQSISDAEKSAMPHTDPRVQMQRLVKSFAGRHEGGYRIYRYRVRHPVLEALGYHVVKIIIPALIPMYLREINASLGARRPREELSQTGSPSGALNPLPHPFL